MKKTSILVLVSCLATLVIAQSPVINSNVIPAKGKTVKYLSSNAVKTFNAGASGTNANWNYSTIDTLKGSIFQHSLKADTTIFYSDFPNVVNYCIEAKGAYGYAFLDASKYESYGLESFGGTQIFSDPVKVLTFPFTYNNQFTDYFMSSDSAYYGKTVVKADAYGTIKLPFGTFSNVLRVNTKDDYRLYTSYDFDGIPDDSLMYDGQYYRWYSPNVDGPVLEYSRLISYINTGSSRINVDTLEHLWLNGTVTTSIKDETANFETTIYPNPTSGKLFINSEEIISTIQIMDFCGKELLNENFVSREVSLDVRNLSSGIYFCQITTADNKRKIVKFLHL
jgi:hypothetical protein